MKKIFTIIALLLCTGLANSQQLDRSIRPSAAPAKAIEIKDAKTFTLSNGLKVFVVEDNRAPIVYYSLLLDVKPSLEKDKAGIQDLFGSVFGTATTTRTKEQINKDIDLIGASVSAHANGGSIRFLKKYETKALEIMSDILLNPVFNQNELELYAGKEKSSLSTLGDDAGLMCDRISAALVYGKGFPDGEIATTKTVDNIQVSDLQNYHNTYFAPNVSRLVIVGDITEKDAKENAEKYFGKWQKKTVAEAQYIIPKGPSQPIVAMIEKPGAVQSSINITYPIEYKTGAPDTEAVSVLRQIFGGSGSGRLFLNLREKHSYTYGVYSLFAPGEQIGRFSLTSGRGAASVKSAVTDSAIYQILYEMDQIIKAPVTNDELKAAKALIAGNFGRSLENSSTIANFAINIDKYKLPKDYYKNYLKRLDAVTLADVQAAAKKYLKPENAWIIVAGDKSIADKLKQFAGNKTVQYYDIDANPVDASKAQVTNITAEDIINKYVEALGGVTAIEKVNDYKVIAEVSAMGQKLEMTQLFKKPNLSNTIIGMNDMVIQKIAFDGTTVRMSGMAGSKEYTEGSEFDKIKEEAALCPELSYAKNGYVLTISGAEQVNGKDAYVLNVKKGENQTISYFDKSSGLKIKSLSSLNTPAGPTQQVVEFSNYQVINGVQFPYSFKQSVGGMTVEASVKSIEINKGIADSEFK